jgi:hypothetical protein
MSNIHFSTLDNVKMTCKHISTKVFFKLLLGIDMLRWHTLTLNMKPVFLFGIWNDDHTKIIVLPTFQITTRLNSQNTNENVFIYELCHINLYMKIGVSNWLNWSFDPTKMKFFTLFHSLHHYWQPTTWNPLEHNSWGNCSDVKYVLFSSPNCEKKKIKRNIKSKCVTEF